MMNKLLFSISVLLVLPVLNLNAQGEIDEQQKVFYRNERTFAVSLNSNGLGIGYREGKRLDFLNKRIAGIEIDVIRHPKELRLTNPYVQTGNSFVFGKLNATAAIRGGLGHQHEIFRKQDLGGIAIRYFYIGGPSLALSKPIYYNVLYTVSGISYELKEEKFNIDIHQPSDIYNRASFFKGINEIKVTPGAYIKGGFNFEYSKRDEIIHAIEIGASLDAYLKELPIMASDDNKALFLTLFISYRAGIVVDPLKPGANRFRSVFFRKQK